MRVTVNARLWFERDRMLRKDYFIAFYEMMRTEVFFFIDWDCMRKLKLNLAYEDGGEVEMVLFYDGMPLFKQKTKQNR